MKKFFLGLFVLASMTLTTACSSDDDSSGGSNSVLVVTIDGQTITFDNIIVDESTFTDDGVTITELDVTAIIGNDATRVIEFGVESGDTGADAVYYFYYTENGQEYFNSFQNFNSVVTVNDGSRLAMTFSGTVTGYDEEQQTEVEVNLQNGSIDVEY